jgi:hypothetical protein
VIRRLSVLVLLPLVLAASGCVEPTVGPTTAAKRSGGAAFPVTSLLPSEAPRAERRAGAIDLFSGGAVAFVEGWTPSPADTLLVVSASGTSVINADRLHRPDAARAVGLVGRDDIGFRLTLRGAAGSVDRICVLARDPSGVLSQLGGSDASLCASP